MRTLGDWWIGFFKMRRVIALNVALAAFSQQTSFCIYIVEGIS